MWTRVRTCQNGHAMLLVWTNGQGCCCGFALLCGTARPQAGFSLLVIGWRFSLALTGLAVAPFLWRWQSFHPLLLFFGRCVGMQGSIFWITCWECSIRFPCNWKPITLLNVDYKIASRVITGLFLKLFISLWPMTRHCGVSGRSIEDSVSLLRDVKHYASTGSVLDPIGLNPMDNRFGFQHWL